MVSPVAKRSSAAPEEFDIATMASVGPVKARFARRMRLSGTDPRRSCRISGEAVGGMAGFASGGACVELVDAAGGTQLSYEVDATVGGRLAQIGGRLVDARAKRMADQFIANLKSRLGPPVIEASGEPTLARPDFGTAVLGEPPRYVGAAPPQS
jgi:hypothetical protein